MKKVLYIFIYLISINVQAQQRGSIAVGGEFGKFYPVVFHDPVFSQNIGTELELGRSNVHTDSDWRGALIAKFRYHNSRGGHGASFLNADIFQINNPNGSPITFVAGWNDASTNDASDARIIWLRGGGTTYYFNANGAVAPVVYDGVQNALPYIEGTGTSHTYKTVLDSYVNSGGITTGTGYFTGYGLNFFEGKVGLGTQSFTDERLAVNGMIRCKEVKVETANWPDYVFNDNYTLPTLNSIDKFIKANKHLPDMPSANEIKLNGQNIGEINSKLLKKVEELTLHLIAKDKELINQQNHLSKLENMLVKQRQTMKTILKKIHRY